MRASPCSQELRLPSGYRWPYTIQGWSRGGASRCDGECCQLAVAIRTLNMGMLVRIGRRAVDSWHGGPVQTEIHSQLSAVVCHVAKERFA